MNAKDATYIEHLFLATVGLPIVIVGSAGLFLFLRNEYRGVMDERSNECVKVG